jgi:hypothetical protein
MKLNVVAGVVGVIVAAACLATAAAQDRDAAPMEVRAFLQRYLGDEPIIDKTATYSSALVDLNGDGLKEVIVYVDSLCGSGGCNLFVLESKKNGFDVVGALTITRPPIRVLKSRTNGWRDLAVWVQGGGIQPGYEALVPFDGSQYASNPTVAPARRARSSAAGDLAIPRNAPSRRLFD